MAKKTHKTRLDFRAVLQNNKLQVDLSDAAVDSIVRGFRRGLQSFVDEGIPKQSEALVEALLPVRREIHEPAEEICFGSWLRLLQQELNQQLHSNSLELQKKTGVTWSLWFCWAMKSRRKLFRPGGVAPGRFHFF